MDRPKEHAPGRLYKGEVHRVARGEQPAGLDLLVARILTKTPFYCMPLNTILFDCLAVKSKAGSGPVRNQQITVLQLQ